jgi:hypothetical protein
MKTVREIKMRMVELKGEMRLFNNKVALGIFKTCGEFEYELAHMDGLAYEYDTLMWVIK